MTHSLDELKGRLVQVEFWDHCIEGPGEKNDELMRFMVWGRIQKITSLLIIIKTWELQVGGPRTKKFNNEIAKILMSAVIDIKFLAVIPDLRIEGH